MPAYQPEMSAVVDDAVKKPVPDEVPTQNSQMNELQGENYEDSQGRQSRCELLKILFALDRHVNYIDDYNNEPNINFS